MRIKLTIITVALAGIFVLMFYNYIGHRLFVGYLKLALIPIAVIVYLYVMKKLFGKKVKEKTEDVFSME